MTDDELLTKPAGVLIKTTLVDFPGCVAATFFLKGCNLRCPYCYNWELVSAENENQNNIQFVSCAAVLEHLYKRKNVIEGLVISGGEPLLNPVTPLLIKKAKSLGIKIKLDTNGTLPDALESIVKNPETTPDFIAMDIKTSPEKYKEKIHTAENLKDKDIEKLLERSVKIISTLSDKNYEIRTVLVPHLVEKEDIKKIAELLPENAAWRFAQFRNENCLDPSYNDIIPYTDSELSELVTFAKTLIKDSVLR
nr:anaerobic ribonucleoside-triphosphate reductase activating protein [uncultured Treponema sp.]